MLRRPRTSNQHATRGGHSDEEEDEGVPASYHTVSLQVSQDVSMAPFTSSAPETQLGQFQGKSEPRRNIQCVLPIPSTTPPPTHTHTVFPLSKTIYKSLLTVCLIIWRQALTM